MLLAVGLERVLSLPSKERRPKRSLPSSISLNVSSGSTESTGSTIPESLINKREDISPTDLKEFPVEMTSDAQTSFGGTTSPSTSGNKSF